MQRRIEVLRAAVKKYVRREFVIMAIHYKDFLKINKSKSAGEKGSCTRCTRANAFPEFRVC